MKTVVRIDDEAVSAEEFINYLKFTGDFKDVVERYIRNKVTAKAALKRGIKVSTEEIQQAADDFRRCIGLHRARDTHAWMEKTGITEDEYESFISDHVSAGKMMDAIISEESVESYFQLNSPKFDTVDVQHIVVESEEKANEIAALVSESPDSFDEFAGEYSLDSRTRDEGGRIAGLRRDALPGDVDAMVFNAQPGEILGPFKIEDELFEIIRVTSIKPAKFDSYTKDNIARMIHDEWLEERLKEHKIEM